MSVFLSFKSSATNVTTIRPHPIEISKSISVNFVVWDMESDFC